MGEPVRPEDVRAWEKLTVAVLVLGAVVVVGSLAEIPVPATAFTLRRFFEIPVDVAGVFFVVTALVWRWMTRRFRRALNDEEAGRRFAAAWVAAIAVYVVADCVIGKALTGPDALHRLLVMSAIFRSVWMLLALGVIVAMHRDMRGVLAGKRRIVPVASERIHYDTVPTAGVGPADDAFWQSVAAAAAAAATDLPLLETTRALERRWLLVSAAGDVAGVRAEVAPDAVVTLFPASPSAGKPAPEYYGLIQREPGGPVRFQLVLPSRVNDFLASARDAHRTGLYTPADPAARAALTAAEQPA